MKDEKRPPTKDQLRRLAEKRLRELGACEPPATEVDARKLLHELQVHQVELEMQNEELQRAHAENETLLTSYTNLYEFAPNGYATLDRAGTILKINITGTALLGGERSDLMGKHLQRFLDPGARPAFAAFLKGVFENAQTRREGTFLQAKVGSRMIRLVASPWSGAQESNVFLEDVTERLLAEKARDEARNFLDAVMNAIGDPVFVKDSELRYAFVNDAYCDFMGVTRAQLLGSTGEGAHSPEELKAFGQEDHRVLQSGGTRVTEIRINRASGTAHTISIVRTLYSDPSGKRFLVGAFSDITVHKKLEHHLQEVGELKSSMISLVSHEYANALTTMRLATHLLEQSEVQPVDDSRGQSYEVLRRAIEHLKASTANFLNLNRLESGKLVLDFRPTSIRAVALEVLTVLRPLSAAKRLDLRLQAEFPDALPIPVRADREALSLIMNNLITNAIKYTPEAGSVTIRIAADVKDSSQILFSVADTGIGIPAGDRDRIFSGFFRTEESKHLAKGFGVGLRLVKELLEKHGSRLEFESEPGKGSRFYFRLPFWTVADPARASSQAQA
jgi:PAS domain S-box-containing protein